VNVQSTDRFQTRRLSELADKIAVLSELNETVLGSVLWPGINSWDVSAASGLRSLKFNVHVSMLLFFSNATTYTEHTSLGSNTHDTHSKMLS